MASRQCRQKTDRLTTRKVKKVSSSLQNKGFTRNNDDADHVQYVLSVDGRKTSIRTRMSHGENEIGEPLIKAMSRQLKLSKQEFLDLIDCSLDGEGYVSKLRDSGRID